MAEFLLTKEKQAEHEQAWQLLFNCLLSNKEAVILTDRVTNKETYDIKDKSR